ncbi:MAG: chromosome partitioning protein ParB [Thermoleophilaceae bacterium]
MPDTGFPLSDAQADFGRARRRRVLAALADRLRGEPDDVRVILPFNEVLEALGHAGSHDLGLQSIPLDTVVGTADQRGGDFDRSFRPMTGRVRGRWERIALAERRGEAMPPIDVYRIGELHFVRDGHHRVSVARARRRTHIEAYVREVRTKLDPGRSMRVSDLALKSHERLFYERVPLPPGWRARIDLPDYWGYAVLAEAVEAWGFRASQEVGEFLNREEVARRWFEEEYEPVVEMLREAQLLGDLSEAQAYMRVSAERYRLMRTHQWSDEAIERVRRELR